MLDLSDFSILKKVISPSGMPYASASTNYAFAEFARDAIEACLDIIPTLPSEITQPIAFATIKRLAELQGEQNSEDILKDNDVFDLTSEDRIELKQLTLSEERKGKIHHEHRSDEVNDTPIPLHARSLLKQLSMIWGGSEHEMTYYGSIDATPQYIRLIALYCNYFGSDLLEAEYLTKLGKPQTLRESLFQAISYIESEIKKSPLGLYEMYRINSEGLKNQTWKDSPTAFITLDKTLPDYNKHIIPLTVQGLVYDALVEAAQLLEDRYKEKSQLWKSLADTIKNQIFTHFWMEDEQYFSSALEQDEENTWQQIKTLSSDPAIVLSTQLFDTCTTEQKKLYLQGIVDMIYSDQFITDVGLRCRAKKHTELVNYSDYHGAEAVWPKETYDCIVGLRNQGFLRLGEQLGIRLLNGVLLADSFYELFFVKNDGRVSYDPSELRSTPTSKEPIYATSIPEETQTWTTTAALAEYQIRNKGLYKKIDKTSWQYSIEESLLKKMPYHKLIQTDKEIEQALPLSYSFSIDLKEGKKRAEKYENLLIHASL